MTNGRKSSNLVKSRAKICHFIVPSPSTALNIRLGSKEERFPIANDTTVGLIEIKFSDIPAAWD